LGWRRNFRHSRHCADFGTKIIVPAKSYDAQIDSRIAQQNVVVYMLPDYKPLQQVFNSYDVMAGHPSAVPAPPSSKHTPKGA